MTPPLVSIIVPCYNAERWVAESIQSALDQSHPNVEVIVIDDGSTDGSLEEIKKYGDRIQWKTGANRGACAARNRALRLSRGQFVKFLDADDFLCPNAVSDQVAFASGLAEGQIGYGRHSEIRQNGRVVGRRRVLRDREHPIANLILRNITTSLSLYPAHALHAVNGFDERLPFRQEWNLNLRLAVSGSRFVFDDTHVFYQRLHDAPSRITNRKYVAEREIENLSCTRKALAPVNSQSVDDAWAAYLWQTGRNFLRVGDTKAAAQLFAMAALTSPSGYKSHFPFQYNLAVALLGPQLVERANMSSVGLRRLKRTALSFLSPLRTHPADAALPPRQSPAIGEPSTTGA